MDSGVPIQNEVTHFPSLGMATTAPLGGGAIATLKKSRVLNATDYRNGGQIPIEFEKKHSRFRVANVQDVERSLSSMSSTDNNAYNDRLLHSFNKSKDFMRCKTR